MVAEEERDSVDRGSEGEKGDERALERREFRREVPREISDLIHQHPQLLHGISTTEEDKLRIQNCWAERTRFLGFPRPFTAPVDESTVSSDDATAAVARHPESLPFYSYLSNLFLTTL